MRPAANAATAARAAAAAMPFPLADGAAAGCAGWVAGAGAAGDTGSTVLGVLVVDELLDCANLRLLKFCDRKVAGDRVGILLSGPFTCAERCSRRDAGAMLS